MLATSTPGARRTLTTPTVAVAVANEITSTSAAYPDREIQGRMRVLKEKLARRFAAMEAAFEDESNQWNASNMVFRTSLVGRKRSFQKLQRAFGRNARLEAFQLDCAEPLALWSMIRPRIPVIALPGESSLDREHCLAVYYTLVGKIPEKVPGEGNSMVSGVWGLAVGDHGLGRCLHRSAPSSAWETAVTTTLAGAHHHLLRCRHRHQP